MHALTLHTLDPPQLMLLLLLLHLLLHPPPVDQSWTHTGSHRHRKTFTFVLLISSSSSRRVHLSSFTPLVLSSASCASLQFSRVSFSSSSSSFAVLAPSHLWEDTFLSLSLFIHTTLQFFIPKVTCQGCPVRWMSFFSCSPARRRRIFFFGTEQEPLVHFTNESNLTCFH